MAGRQWAIQASGSVTSFCTCDGRLPRDDIGQGDLLQDRAQAGSHGDPHLLEVLGRAVVVGRLGAEAPHLGQRPVEGADHVGHGDRRRDPGPTGSRLRRPAGSPRCRPAGGRPGWRRGSGAAGPAPRPGTRPSAGSRPRPGRAGRGCRSPPWPGCAWRESARATALGSRRAPRCVRAKISLMARVEFHLSGDAEADALLEQGSVGLAHRHGAGPADHDRKGLLLTRRAGPAPWAARSTPRPSRPWTLDELTAVFKEPPALHRYPGSMAGRVQDVCRVIAEEYGDKADAIWKGVKSGDELIGAAEGPPRVRSAEGEDLRRPLGQAARASDPTDGRRPPRPTATTAPSCPWPTSPPPRPSKRSGPTSGPSRPRRTPRGEPRRRPVRTAPLPLHAGPARPGRVRARLHRRRGGRRPTPGEASRRSTAPGPGAARGRGLRAAPRSPSC